MDKILKNNMSVELNQKIEKLNKETSNNLGKWINDERLGIVWIPNENHLLYTMGDNAPVIPKPHKPSLELESILQWGNTYDFDNITKNSVV